MQSCRMLVGLEDIPMMLKDKAGDRRYNSWLIWTGNQQRNHLVIDPLFSVCWHISGFLLILFSGIVILYRTIWYTMYEVEAFT